MDYKCGLCGGGRDLFVCYHDVYNETELWIVILV